MRYLRNLFVGRRTFDVSISRRFRRRIVSGILVFVTISGCFYGFSQTTKADAINTTDFVTTWKTDNTGVSSATSITIPTQQWYTYNYSVDWDNDGTPDETGITGNVTHDFGVAGTYTIRISGVFPSIYFSNSGDKDKILSVDQWGANQWETMRNAFMGANNLAVLATDSPDLSLVIDMGGMFFGASSMNQNIGAWNTGNVQDMGALFANATSFNQSLNNWNTSNVTNMSAMFSDATSFNQPLDSWSVGNVTTMDMMFGGATSFNQSLNSWDTSSVLYMGNMFYNATSFNQPLDSWDTSSVRNMTGMFSGASSFNQPLDGWSVSNVTEMMMMFYGATSFNQSVGSWDTTNVTSMQYVFMGASSFNQPVGSWNTTNVTTMEAMFDHASSFDQPITAWNTANVTDMSSMFNNATSFNQPLSTWDTSKVTSMTAMFEGASSFNQPINSWNVSSVASLRAMFNSATSFNQPLGSWNTGNVSNMSAMFNNATSFNQPLSSWNTSNVTDMSMLFANASAFNQPLDSWDTSIVTNMAAMFQGAGSFNRSLAAWDVSTVTTSMGVFTSMWNMLNNSGLSTTNYGTTLAAWSVLPIQSGVELGAWGLTYCGFEAERQSLIDNHAWIITNDSQGCMAPWPPQNLTATASGDSVTLNWEAPASIGTGIFEGYTVQYQPTGSSGFVDVPNITQLSVTIPNLSLGTSYDFQVLAESSHGTSGPSDYTTAVTGDSATRAFDFSTIGSSQEDVVSKAALSVTSAECYTINLPSLSVLGPNGITAPEENVTILGGLGYSLECTSSGGSSSATITLGTYFDDVSKLRIYKKTGTANLQDITDQVTVVNRTSDTGLVTSIDYTLIDGGAFDEDGVANGTIVDPVYIGLFSVSSPNGSGSLADTGDDGRLAIGVAIVALLSAFGCFIAKLHNNPTL